MCTNRSREADQRAGGRMPASPDLHPDVVRGQSSNVTAVPLSENVTPRAIRDDGTPSG